MAKSHSRELFKSVRFDYKHNVFDENGEILPGIFDFETTEFKEFQYFWKVKYSTRKLLTLNDLLPDDPNNDDKCAGIRRIEVSTTDNLIKGDSAFVTIIIGGKVCASFKFDCEGPLMYEKKVSSEASTSDDPYINVNIKIYHRFEKLPTNAGQINDDYENLFDAKEFCDFTFVIGDKEIPAHKQILLARNSVFRKMFENEMLENKSSRVEIKDIEPDIFENLLRFIYCGKFNLSNVDDHLKLMVAADKYSMTSLVTEIEDRICNELEVENVVDVLVISDLVKAKDLKCHCMSFIFDNKFDVIETEGYKSLAKNQRADLLDELYCYGKFY